MNEGCAALTVHARTARIAAIGSACHLVRPPARSSARNGILAPVRRLAPGHRRHRAPVKRAARAALAAGLAALALGVLPVAASAWRHHGGPPCNGFAALCSRTLDRVVLAGTHNSMSSESLGWAIPNQIGDIPSQLRGGIRALLIDTHYGVRRPDGTVVTADPGSPPPPPGPKETFLCHAYCEIGATPLREGLGWIRDFLRAHRREVMVIVNEDYISPDDYAAAVRDSGLSRYVYRGRTDRFPTLRRMIRRGRRVLMLAEHDAGTVRWYHPAYQGILQETPYSFSTTAELTDPAQLATSCRPNRGGTTAPLFLMNHWVLVNGVPSRAAAQVVNTRQAIVDRARACAKARGKLPTIVAVDSFGIGDLIGAVNELNGVGS